MKRFALRVLGVAALVVGPTTTAAQVDYRNLDDDRPVKVEDAQSAERYAFEAILPYSVAGERDGGIVQTFVPELSYGLARDLHVGIKAPIGLERGDVGLAGLRFFGFYNLNTEFGWMPAFALRVDTELPVGPFASSSARLAVKGIATRAFGANRVHANAAYRFGADGRPGLVEPLPRWWVGIAADRTLYRESLLLVANAVVERATDSTPLSTLVGGGVRWQWTPTSVLDLGISRTVGGDDGHDIEVSFAVTHVFGIRALIPGAR